MEETANILCGGGRPTQEQLRQDCVGGSRTLLSCIFRGIQGSRRGLVEGEEGGEDGIYLGCELSRRGDDDCADMVFLDGLVEA